MKTFLTLAAAALITVGCATVNYANKAMGISMNMSKDDVLAVMGPPKRVAARQSNDGLVERYSWWSPKVVGFTRSITK